MQKYISLSPEETLRVRINELEKIVKKLENKMKDKQQLVISPPNEDNLSNTERIVNILKSEALTSKELANRLNINERDTRTYLLRLKNDEKIRVIQKIGRYNVYTYNKPFDPEKSHTDSNALEYDLSYLLNLMEMKMKLKEGTEFSQSDLLTINRIKFRIIQKKEDITKGMELVREFTDIEHKFKDEIQGKITELKAKINTINPKTVEAYLKELKESISANLDSLLTGPISKELQENLKSLKEIMDTINKNILTMKLENVMSELKELKSGDITYVPTHTMNKSVQTMNLEKVMSELKVLKSGGITYVPTQSVSIGQQPEEISAGSNLNPPGLKAPRGSTAKAQDEGWVDPHEKAKKKEEDQHLLKPSDFFGKTGSPPENGE